MANRSNPRRAPEHTYACSRHPLPTDRYSERGKCHCASHWLPSSLAANAPIGPCRHWEAARANHLLPGMMPDVTKQFAVLAVSPRDRHCPGARACEETAGLSRRACHQDIKKRKRGRSFNGNRSEPHGKRFRRNHRRAIWPLIARPRSATIINRFVKKLQLRIRM